MLYIRIFPLPGLHKVCWIVGAFTILWGVTNLIVLLTQCIPIRHFWDPDTKGHCINQADFCAAAAIIPTLNILVIFVIPIPIVRKLKISTSRRWSLAIAFTIGTLLVLFLLRPATHLWKTSYLQRHSNISASISAIVRFVLYFTITNNDQSCMIALLISPW